VTSLSTQQLGFCTVCGVPLADGLCVGACSESGNTQGSDDSSGNPATGLGAAIPVSGHSHSSHGLTNHPAHGNGSGTASDVLVRTDVRTPHGAAALPRRRHTGSWAAAIVATALVLAAAVAGVIGYRDLSGRITALQSALNDSSRAQGAAQQQLDDMRSRQEQQANQLALTQNQIDEHPAAAKVAKRAGRSVFTIFTEDALGSGFVVNSNRGSSRLLTNYHVVAEDYRAGIRNVDVRRGATSYAGRIVDVSEANDLAVIQVEVDLAPLELVTPRAQVGDPVLAVGSPNGLGGTVTSGIVSAYRTMDATDYMQFSAPISPGNSGGPVLNETGKVLGVAVMKDVHDFTEGISYAIPTARVCEAVDVC
jgi:putative serine protease PepD